jgi:hypothetical protein
LLFSRSLAPASPSHSALFFAVADSPSKSACHGRFCVLRPGPTSRTRSSRPDESSMLWTYTRPHSNDERRRGGISPLACALVETADPRMFGRYEVKRKTTIANDNQGRSLRRRRGAPAAARATRDAGPPSRPGPPGKSVYVGRCFASTALATIVRAPGSAHSL